MLEEQIDRSTADRQLLYDIRTEMRTNNTLLTQLLEVLRPVAKDAVPKKVVKKAKPKPKLKEAKTHGTLPISKRGSSNNKLSGSSARHPNKRKTMPDK